ncbi:dipeptidase [Clostridium sp. C105KSO13]|uniref:dipeptidase n=1 Tax=Clostridium sp. C105KSO13 TaxID=1776045 RepID=UPI0007406AF9|nr:membrane dipeptidase [Clostridium sp. C105KSO13]CUX34740.1 Membrane dipeptidase (Peptidase family M19) [Clostridium sp. C105KSO13]
MQLFDLHCDSIVKYRKFGEGFLCRKTQFSLNDEDGFERHCQTMAIFIPDDIRGGKATDYFNVHRDYLLTLTDKQSELVEMAYTGDDVLRITNNGKCAVMLSAEGGAVLAGKLENIDYMARCGVQMITLVWNGENEIGSGHQTHYGLTAFGREAVKRMEEHNIIVDVSHLNDEGFEEICEIAGKPFIASHSNLRSVCPHNRNLTEEQFHEIVRRKGLVGLNLFEPFLSEEGSGTKDALLRHVYRMLELGGENVIACGSDFDGADIHPSLDTPVKFAGAAQYLIDHGIGKEQVRKMFFDNALKFFMKK